MFSIDVSQIQVRQGQALNVPVTLSGSLQGAGCGGDDGWWEVGPLPPGISWDGQRLSGIYGSAQGFRTYFSATGTDAQCLPVLLWQGFVDFVYAAPALPYFTPGNVQLTVGEAASVLFELSDNGFLQGLACGDDGTIEARASIPGMHLSYPTLSGVPTVPGTYRVELSVLGTSEDCQNVVEYLSQTVEIVIVAQQRLSLPCGAASGKVVRLLVCEVAQIQGWDAAETPDYSLVEEHSPIELEFTEASFSLEAREGPGGTFYEANVQADLGRQRPDLMRLLSRLRGKDLGCQITDAYGQSIVVGDNFFPLRLLDGSSLDGKQASVKVSLSGQVPFARLVEYV